MLAMAEPKISFIASDAPDAQKAKTALAHRYGNSDFASADVIVALGGDGLMLRTMHKVVSSGTPIYGMHRGSVGFLMNDYQEDDLVDRLENAEATVIHPLKMSVASRAQRWHHSCSRSTGRRC